MSYQQPTAAEASLLSEIDKALSEVRLELYRASGKHAPFNGAHEGYAVILEELDELWDEVKRRDQHVRSMRNEAIQIAAMATRFMLDVTGI
jgi:hypothetical protein